MNVKFALRKKVAAILGWFVRRLYRRAKFKTVVVAGSVGKTTTKHVIAQYLENAGYKVRYQKGNYNDLVTVPLVFFGLPLPDLYSPLAWIKTFWQIEHRLGQPFDYDIVVLELGTNGPGQIEQFARYVRADVAVITAIAPEHMERFNTIDAVAEEELSVIDFAEHIIVNADDTPKKHLKSIEPALYGSSSTADYRLSFRKDAQLTVMARGSTKITFSSKLVGRHTQKAIAGAYAVGDALDLVVDDPQKAFENIEPMPGRMQLLNGVKGSIIIDDTYNASPSATQAALDYLYSRPESKKIAVLGNMNEMGEHSAEAHQKIGRYCDSGQLYELITLGEDAAEHIGGVAHNEGGVSADSYSSPHRIGVYLRQIVDEDTVVLLKGSQNGVFLEEAIKPILADSSDETKLVRQSDDWLYVKHEQFDDNPQLPTATNSS